MTAALSIVLAFEILHAVGYSYQGINEGGVAIDMNSGEVLICDCDNISPDGTNLGILGVMRYMAPEVVLRKKLPDRDTDRYSLAVLLFMLFFNSHPMHGMESVALHADENVGQQEADRRIYGSAPHYCLSQANPVNPPHERLLRDVRRLCGLYPRVLLETFGADYTTPVGKIVASPKPRVLALYNASGGELQVAYQGKTRMCHHGEYMPLIPGSTITVNHLEIGIR